MLRGFTKRSLRRVKFTMPDPNEVNHETRKYIWPRRALRWEVTDRFAERVAKGIKGRKYGWKRGPVQPGDDNEVNRELMAIRDRLREMKVDNSDSDSDNYYSGWESDEN